MNRLVRRVLFPVSAVAVGAVFLLTGILRPPFLWNMGKVETGRAIAGETAVAVLFIALGIALPIVAILLFVKDRSRS